MASNNSINSEQTLSPTSNVTFNTVAYGDAATTRSNLGLGTIATANSPLPVGNGGLGITSTPTNGQIPIGNGTNYTAASPTSTAGTVTVTTGSGTLSFDVTHKPPVQNLGFSYASGTGTFTIHSADGTALSSSNPGYVTLQSKANPGYQVTIAVTSNQNFVDDNGTSEIIGNLFGLTTGVATSVDIPFFLYAVMNDSANAIQFMISRYPNANTSPASGIIGTPSSAVADTQGSFFSFDSITTTDYDQNPCLCIGSFRMRMSASDDWTVQTLTNSDGIGKFQEGVSFTFPRGQFGAASSKVFKNNGGTAPDDADGTYVYYVDKYNNQFTTYMIFSIDTSGTGGVPLTCTMPYTVEVALIRGIGSYLLSANYTMGWIASGAASSTSTTHGFVEPSSSGIINNNNVLIGDNVQFTVTAPIEYA